MPPRLNKRQLREQEELAALEAVETPDLSHGQGASEESDPETVPVVVTGFAALMNAGGESEEEDTPRSTSTKKFKQKKKKKKNANSSPAVAPSPKPSSPDPSKQSPSTKQGGSKKKQPTSNKKKGKATKADDDDFDKVLAELSLQYPSSMPSESARATQASTDFFSLLSVSPHYLDSEAEMRKFFGAKVISASKAADASSSSASGQRRNQRMDARSILCRPENTWYPPSLRQGLAIRSLTDEELEGMKLRNGFKECVSGEKIWTVELSNKYRGASKVFMELVLRADVDGLFHILRSFPYHADTLLQLSEVYLHREEHSTAADYIDRALFTYERAFSGAFSLTSGTNRLDFDRVENRPFFLAVHRKVADLLRRGCVRTSFEFGKLLYSLDPSTDPHGALLHLDFLAIKAGMPQWITQIWDAHGKLTGDQSYGRYNVRAMPNWAYSRALVLFIAEETKIEKNHDESTAALKDAILAFPSVVPLLADKLGAAISGDIRSHPAFRIHVDASKFFSECPAILHALSHLYAQRSFTLWKPKSRTTWFTTTVNSLVPLSKLPEHPTTQAFHSLYSSPPIRYSVYRHLLVMESTCRSLFAFIPASVTEGKRFACDPIPPPTKVTEYDDEFFKGAEDPLAIRARGRRETERLLARLLPDPLLRQQLQDIFERNPQLRERFGARGFLQFAQFIAQLPEDALMDMLIAEAEAGGQNPGEQQGELHMPGMFGAVEEPIQRNVDDGNENVPDAEEDLSDEGHEDEDEDDDEDLEPVQPLPVRFLRNVLNRFWGGGGTQTNQDESSDDEEPTGNLPPVDPNDVD